jgi:protein-disulfide isomerase/uncharacterized membrane protein
MIRRWALWAAVAAAAVGVAFAVLSTHNWLRIRSEGLEQASYCALSATINCDLVSASSYAAFLGVPIAWWGVCFYAAVGGLALLCALSRRDRRATAAAAWFLSCGGLLYSFYLAYISFYVLGVLCVECMGMYAANIALFLLLFAALGVPSTATARFVRDYAMALVGRSSNLGFRPQALGHALAVALVFLVGWGIFASVEAKGKEERPTGASVDEKVKAFYMQSLHDIPIDPRWPVWGNPDAKVTIVEFSEYQCPFCRLSAFEVKPYLTEFRRDIRYYFVNYPLDNSCNDLLQRPMHPIACEASRAGLCAQERGDFWGFHDELFRNQRQLSESKILDIAAERGWDRDEFSRCMESAEMDGRVRSDVAVGRKIYIEGTPSIFLDGRKLKYWRDPEFLQAIIREEIKRSSKVKGER